MKLCVIKHIPFEENYLKKKAIMFSLKSCRVNWMFGVLSALSLFFISIQKNISGRAGGKKKLFSNKFLNILITVV